MRDRSLRNGRLETGEVTLAQDDLDQRWPLFSSGRMKMRKGCSFGSRRPKNISIVSGIMIRADVEDRRQAPLAPGSAQPRPARDAPHALERGSAVSGQG